jgi:hypothetical protein
MKKWIVAITVMLLAGLGATSVHAGQAQVGSCENYGLTGVKVLATTASRTTSLDFVGSGGQFDQNPLFTTSVKSSSQSCIIATLSTLAKPHDNWIMFQVLVDGKPMYGHVSSDEFFTEIGYPELTAYVKPARELVGDPEAGDKNLYRMLSYTFYMPVGQGTHTVEVKWAGCCTLIGPYNENTFEIGRSTLLIHYK